MRMTSNCGKSLYGRMLYTSMKMKFHLTGFCMYHLQCLGTGCKTKCDNCHNQSPDHHHFLTAKAAAWVIRSGICLDIWRYRVNRQRYNSDALVVFFTEILSKCFHLQDANTLASQENLWGFRSLGWIDGRGTVGLTTSWSVCFVNTLEQTENMTSVQIIPVNIPV